MSSISNNPIPFLETNYVLADANHAVLKKDPTSELINIHHCAIHYYAGKDDKPTVFLKANERSSDTVVSNALICAHKLEKLALPIIDVKKNSSRTPPKREVEENIRDWKFLTAMHLSKLQEMPKGNPNANPIAMQCKQALQQADIALNLRPEEERQDKIIYKKRLTIVAVSVMSLALAGIAAYFTLRGTATSSQ